MNPALRRLVKIILWTAGIWAALIIFIELVLSSSFMTKTVQRIAAEHVDGDVSFGNASLSMFRKFPYATLILDVPRREIRDHQDRRSSGTSPLQRLRGRSRHTCIFQAILRECQHLGAPDRKGKHHRHKSGTSEDIRPRVLRRQSQLGHPDRPRRQR